MIFRQGLLLKKKEESGLRSCEVRVIEGRSLLLLCMIGQHLTGMNVNKKIL